MQPFVKVHLHLKYKCPSFSVPRFVLFWEWWDFKNQQAHSWKQHMVSFVSFPSSVEYQHILGARMTVSLVISTTVYAKLAPVFFCLRSESVQSEQESCSLVKTSLNSQTGLVGLWPKCVHWVSLAHQVLETTSRFQRYCLGVTMLSPLQHFYGNIGAETILDVRLWHCSYKAPRLQSKNQKCPPEAILMTISGLVCLRCLVWSLIFQAASCKSS